MLDGHDSGQPSIPTQLVWENVAINSILSINNLTQPDNSTLPQLIKISILIFDIRTIGLIDTGAAAWFLRIFFLNLERKRLSH